MAIFNARTINAAVEVSTELKAADAEEALKIAVEGAIKIAGEEVSRGAPASAVVVTVEDLTGVEVHRVAVSASVASLVRSATLLQ